MSGFVPESYEWEISPEDEALFRERLPELHELTRAELAWWCAQRGKASLKPPPDLEGLAPDPDAWIDKIKARPDPGRRRADWALTYYALICSLEDVPGEQSFRPMAGQDVAFAVDHALAELALDTWFWSTRIGACVRMIGMRP